MPSRRRGHARRCMHPVESIWGRVLAAEVQPYRVRLLFSALELEKIIELLRKQAHMKRSILHFDRLGKLLPKLRNRHTDPAVVAHQTHDGIGAQASRFPGGRLHAIAPERTRHPAMAVHVVSALPVLAAAGILIDLQRTRRGPRRLADFRRPVHLRFAGILDL